MTRGWMGLLADVCAVLTTVGADRTADGAFCVAPPGSIVTGLGGGEVCIDGHAHYFVQGEPRPLAELLNRTSYGVRGIAVI